VLTEEVRWGQIDKVILVVFGVLFGGLGLIGGTSWGTRSAADA
jgi:hypothetical protein